MCKSPASPEIPTRGHAHGAVEKRERSEQGLCGKIGRKAVNRKLLHIAQGLCREFGVWKRPCRGRAVPSRRNACGKNRVALKWGRFQICHCEGALRPWQSREGTADLYRPPGKRTRLVGAGLSPPGAARTTRASCRYNGERPRFVIARPQRGRGNLGKALAVRTE